MDRRPPDAEGANPRASVVLPIHDRAEVFGRAVESVLTQTETDWELIVVDDGSADAPETVLKGFGDPRIKFIRHADNRGASAARNTGMEASRGQFVAFLDSDDVWFPDRLAAQLRKLEESDAAAIVCGVSVVTASGARRGIPRLDGDALELLTNFESGVIHTSAVTIRQFVVEQGIRFDDRLPAYQEFDFLLQIARRGLGILGARDVLVEVRYDYPQQHISNPAAHLAALELIGQKYQASMAGRGRSSYHLKLMRAHLGLGNVREARKESRRAVAAEPLMAQRWPIALGSLLGDRAFANVYRIYSSLATSRRWRMSGAAGQRVA